MILVAKDSRNFRAFHKIPHIRWIIILLKFRTNNPMLDALVYIYL